MYREDFINACISYADEFRVRQQPNFDNFGQQVLDDCGKLKVVRNYLCDWVLLEGNVTQEEEFTDALIDMLERLYELKSRPVEVTSWHDSWFGAQSVFVYETFLYIVAALIKVGCYKVLNDIYTSNYINPPTVRNSNFEFDNFSCFFGYSEALQSVLRPNEKLYSPAAELIHLQADREDITFQDLAQSESLTFMMSVLKDVHWYPGTLHYVSHYQRMPFFLRATQHKHFRKLATVTGIESGNELRDQFKVALASHGITRSNTFFRMDFSSLMNIEDLDTIN